MWRARLMSQFRQYCQLMSLCLYYLYGYIERGGGERERVHARDLMPHGRFRENPEFKQEQYQFRCAADTSIIIANGQIER